MSDQALDEGVQLSIGEVLALVQEEFPDVTISKIRFLESQGLIQPDRTASGYRRFSGDDIERLRWILRQQRDHFLPLKVIRRMLEEGVDAYDPGGGQPTLWTPSDGLGGDDLGPGAPSGETDADAEDDDGSGAHTAAAPDAGAPSSGRGPAGSSRHSPRHPAVASSPRRFETPADVVAALQEDPRPSRAAAPAAEPPVAPPVRPEAADPLPEGEVGAEELCRSTGLGPLYLEGLVRFGLVRPVVRGGEDHFGPDAVVVARLATRYAELGVEPRHLRMYLVAAAREAGFVEQLAVPLLKQRHPAAREQAAALATELATLGAELHGVLLRRELGPDLGGPAPS